MESQNGLEGASKIIEFQIPSKKPTTKQNKENLLVGFTIITALLCFIHIQENLIITPPMNNNELKNYFTLACVKTSSVH